MLVTSVRYKANIYKTIAIYIFYCMGLLLPRGWQTVGNYTHRFRTSSWRHKPRTWSPTFIQCSRNSSESETWSVETGQHRNSAVVHALVCELIIPLS